MKMSSTNVLIYHCWLCSEEFKDKLGILKHIKANHKDRPELIDIEKKMKVPLCLECGSTQSCEHKQDTVTEANEQDEEDDDVDDPNTVSKPRLINCVTCTKSFTVPDSLHKHRMIEHPTEKAFQCIFCPNVYSERTELVAHKLIHSGNRPYICTICGNRFPKCSDLKRHSIIHTRLKPFHCAQCDKCFTQKSSLEKHAKIHAKHSGGHPCLLCGLVFNELTQLIDHSQSNHADISFCCKICGKMYSEERHLVHHEKNHSMVKPYACSYCDRRFSIESLLIKHEEKMHTSKKDIICDVCGKVFKRMDNLNRHKVSHTGVKSHICPHCGISFTEKGSLTRHIKAQHDLIRPHTCQTCGRSFTRKTLLRKHVDRCHGVKQPAADVEDKTLYFKCKLCNKHLRISGKRQHIKLHKMKGENYDDDIVDDDTKDNDVSLEDKLDQYSHLQLPFY
ncbi:gastrula zinc finger protein XlCGF26.1-like [Biomphalaria glabrata]|uniref:Gastrula zinc finger protein XlCGF26.1-like n=1 Tax=Biomphalaria glabrata TaxID=6526 RepID=A0A9W2YW64_BIOGL|nr:gastrula zinc finger protein XlCGF26.1-like [Biomphalaria glabrata]XP_055866994.1 gastrula zinc finger protein XlCGF26.1-like [Biomphalaria glabrata]XP_055866995.1 gastrula zinc finger protein XlCGF26.1-like [Biomphalaria glabrata]XP_055866996.1 gastrula zinc finger protein XlCGF26.1-like [Biomphalaria glabrata]KAI8745656.1 gastrula zinc finger protein XlCGF26.1-like [Biomphalaria glabrata]